MLYVLYVGDGYVNFRMYKYICVCFLKVFFFLKKNWLLYMYRELFLDWYFLVGFLKLYIKDFL